MKKRSHRNWQTNLFIGLALILAFVVGSKVTIAYQHYKLEQATNHIYSHRGTGKEETEHTYAAYNLARAYGSQYIEQDLVDSKNHTLWISHDYDTGRITGKKEQFKNTPDSMLKRLQTADHQKLLTLQDVFTKYGKSTKYVIELRTKEFPNQVQELYDLIKKNHLENKVIIQGHYISDLKQTKKLLPNSPTLFLVQTQKDLERGSYSKYVNIIGADKILMNINNVKLVHKHGKEFDAWTLDSDYDIGRAINLGVDNYFTDYTDKAILLENQYRPVSKLKFISYLFTHLFAH